MTQFPCQKEIGDKITFRSDNNGLTKIVFAQKKDYHNDLVLIDWK